MKEEVLQTMHWDPGFWIAPNWQQIRKIAMTSQLPDITSSSISLTFFVSRVKFSYWSKFLVNIFTGCGVMTTFFYKRLTRNRKTPVRDLPKIWRLGWVRDTKLGAIFSNEMLLNAAKYQGYRSYGFWITKGNKPGGAGGKLSPHLD